MMHLVHAQSTLLLLFLLLQVGDPSTSNIIFFLDKLTIQGGETHTHKV